jgi:hypothetical protein
MREKLNENPMAQAALVGVLLVAAAFLLISSMHGGSEESPEEGVASPPAAPSAVASAELPAAAQPGIPLSSSLPPPPQPVLDAVHADQTVVLLFVRAGGIDDRLVAQTLDRLEPMSGVATFVIPASRLARYASIAEGVDLNRLPALVVVRPKRLSHGYDAASVHYGFQSTQSMVQAVVDSRYRGGTLPYHP